MSAPAAVSPASGRRVTPFKVRSIKDLLSSPVQLDYLIKRLLAPGESSVWYGEPGSGKSFVLLSIGYNLSLGRGIFGWRVQQTPVLYVCLESERGFERRVRAIASRCGPSAGFQWIAEPANLFGEPPDVRGIIEAARRMSARLIVIDTLSRAIGTGNENESTDMNKFIRAVDDIRRETGAHVALVHHCGKDKTRGMRGHSSLLAAADVVIEIGRNRTRGTRTLEVVKAKDDIDGGKHNFRLETVDLGKDEEGDPITSCVVTAGNGTASAVDGPKLAKGPRVALECLKRLVEEQRAVKEPRSNQRETEGVEVNEWRTAAYGAGISAGQPRARQQAFQRAMEALQDAGLVCVSGERVRVLPVQP